MSRKDIIIIAVLVNAAILAVIFMTANNIEETAEENRYDISSMIVEEEKNLKGSTSMLIAENKSPEELDRVMSGFAPLQSGSQDLTMDEAIAELDKELSGEDKTDDEEIAAKLEEASSSFIEVSVKRGDSLEKIAKGNGITIEELKKANNLKNDKLLIGQSLKIPQKTKKTSVVASKPSPTPAKPALVPLKVETETEYHIVKAGDNPWKIAKQYHVRVDDLLKLNGMNEEKARNMKVGDKIRVR